MMIPFSSKPARRRQAPATAFNESQNAPYMRTALAYQLLPDDEEAAGEGRMGFLEHFEELRTRLLRASIAIGLGMLAAFTVIDKIVNFVLEPTRRMLPPGAHLIHTQPGEAFGLWIQVAL